jgi:nitroreductase
MDILKAIEQVWFIRAYRREPLPEAVLARIVDAGRHAGSSKNAQRWDFVVVRDPDSLRRLGDIGPYAGHLPAAGAAIALVTPAPSPGQPYSVMWDLGRAAQNMVLAAWALGVGSCPVTVYEQPLVHEILGLPVDAHCEYVLALGWPADPEDLTRPPKAGGRKSLPDVMHDERW